MRVKRTKRLKGVVRKEIETLRRIDQGNQSPLMKRKRSKMPIMRLKKK
jgi:hypothetical protein